MYLGACAPAALEFNFSLLGCVSFIHAASSQSPSPRCCICMQTHSARTTQTSSRRLFSSSQLLSDQTFPSLSLSPRSLHFLLSTVFFDIAVASCLSAVRRISPPPPISPPLFFFPFVVAPLSGQTVPTAGIPWLQSCGVLVHSCSALARL